MCFPDAIKIIRFSRYSQVSHTSQLALMGMYGPLHHRAIAFCLNAYRYKYTDDGSGWKVCQLDLTPPWNKPQLNVFHYFTEPGCPPGLHQILIPGNPGRTTDRWLMEHRAIPLYCKTLQKKTKYRLIESTPHFIMRFYYNHALSSN